MISHREKKVQSEKSMLGIYLQIGPEVHLGPGGNQMKDLSLRSFLCSFEQRHTSLESGKSLEGR
jgi:hypothetical protein